MMWATASTIPASLATFISMVIPPTMMMVFWGMREMAFLVSPTLKMMHRMMPIMNTMLGSASLFSTEMTATPLNREPRIWKRMAKPMQPPMMDMVMVCSRLNLGASSVMTSLEAEAFQHLKKMYTKVM